MTSDYLAIGYVIIHSKCACLLCVSRIRRIDESKKDKFIESR